MPESRERPNPPRIVVTVVLIWAAFWMATWPALLADLQGDPFISKGIEAVHCRHDMGGAMFFGALPPIWFFAPFFTGFYEHGFKWSCP